VTADYRDTYLQDHKQALAQTLAILPVVARIDATPAEVIAAATAAASHQTSFEKDGYTWVGGVGLRFGENGRLVAALPAWEIVEDRREP
jgi:hypothetical protein